jgi:NAD(P)-dependent dehydrogenase (short-subunit alcohol dehydrogenase family)
METSLKGKTAIVTGGTNGIGLVTAKELARMGAHVTIVSRSEAKCFRTAEAIRQETGQPVEFITADLSTIEGIMQAASDFKHHHTRLEILVNNAGALFMRRHVTADGYEMTFALNHLNYFLLTNLLMDMLKASAPARIVNVASTFAGELDLTDLQFERRGYDVLKAYAQSKACNRLLTWALARRLEGTGVTVNAYAPGFVAGTELSRDFAPEMKAAYGTRAGRTFEQGADTAVWLGSEPALEGVSGRFFMDRREIPCNLRDERTEEALWAECERACGR